MHKHLSVRVPWHDRAWDGCVCNSPENNSSCVILSNINEKKDDVKESKLKGKKIDNLARPDIPPCVREHGAFMCGTDITIDISHPYMEMNDDYKHFKTTPFRIPAYSLPAVPFRWMMKNPKDSSSEIAEDYRIDYDPEKEPDFESFDPMWVQEYDNQKAILDKFFSFVKPKKSLVFIYAKDVPFSEEKGRVVLGVGFINSMEDVKEYNYDSKGERRSCIWEVNVLHSIRPDMKDGFILPYHEILAKFGNTNDIDFEDITIEAPDWSQFSYGTEHVNHDVAIDCLLSMAEVLRKAEVLLGKSYKVQLDWISSRISELWEYRGAYPGLGAVLRGIGLDDGNFIAWEIYQTIEKKHGSVLKADPWTYIDGLFMAPGMIVPQKYAQKIGGTIQAVWKNYTTSQKSYLKLLSRIELTNIQAARFLFSTEAKYIDPILANPYKFFEDEREYQPGISFKANDKAMFPPPNIRAVIDCPVINESIDKRRVRALVVDILEKAALHGHTLLPLSVIMESINKTKLDPACTVNMDIMKVVESYFEKELVLYTYNDEKFYQLSRFEETQKTVNDFVVKRISGMKHKGNHDWDGLVKKELGPVEKGDTLEKKAREEKAAALQELYQSRFTVLAGLAGTGKTTLLSALCKLKSISDNGILLLAPTGKARVRMQQKIGREAKTVSQYLYECERYIPESGRYKLFARSKRSEYSTVIIDEASMLTESQLASVIDSLNNVERFILVGDYRQLPPIGEGRPFVDVINYIKGGSFFTSFPRVSPGYAELTIVRRQKQASKKAMTDMEFAGYFSDSEKSSNESEIFEKLATGADFERIKAVAWSTETDLHKKLLAEIMSELNLKGIKDESGFEKSLGGKESDKKDFSFFNTDSSLFAEKWQILSPQKGFGSGTKKLNRIIQKTFRARTIVRAHEYGFKTIPKPIGEDGIVYGDKVINTMNQHRNKVYPETPGAMNYVANGEIGIVTGMYKPGWRGQVPINVAYSSQPGYSYVYYPYDFAKEDRAFLELAYAITVHKSQGSDFDTVFIIVPMPCRQLSKELLYTAFTRQRGKVVVFCQGDLTNLRKFGFDEFSEVKRRVTNLFNIPKLIKHGNLFFESNLIHRTEKGEFVRSKSEVIVANLLYSKSIEYTYEKQLKGKDGVNKYPDFTIYDADSGNKYYWEHLGMLVNEEYKKDWEKKQKWYKENGILPLEKGGGENGFLITSMDDSSGGIDSTDIAAKAKIIKGN